jgi:hypothetical protein
MKGAPPLSIEATLEIVVSFSHCLEFQNDIIIIIDVI